MNVDNKRYHHLDSMRGLAAFSVMIHHFIITYPAFDGVKQPAIASTLEQIFGYSPLHFFWAGHEAVMFFFILSGLVLSIPFWKGNLIDYRFYFAKRIVRLYPPYLVSILFAMLARTLFYDGPQEGVAYWLNRCWTEPVHLKIVIQHVLMIGFFENHLFNPVLWSLIHEMRISLMFPFFFLFLKRGENRQIWVISCFILFSIACWAYNVYRPIKLGADSFNTLHYLGFFGIGAMVARYREKLIDGYQNFPRAIKVGLLSIAVLAYTNAYWLQWFSDIPVYKVDPAGFYGHKISQEWITAFGVVIFIIASFGSGSITRALDWKPIRFLGDISYSLYLLHCVVLKIFLSCFYGKIALPWIFLITAVGSLLLSWMSYRWIEKPTIAFCRKLTEWSQNSARKSAVAGT